MLLVLADHPEDQKTIKTCVCIHTRGSNHRWSPYYDSATLELLDDLLNKRTQQRRSIVCKSNSITFSASFYRSNCSGRKARELNPYLVSAYGVLTDANLELGNYQKAIRYADTMVSIRPDIRSYSRISYLREIHGDINGAIDAMKMAVEAGYPGLEQTEWCRVQLGHLYESSGDLFQAQNCYKNSVYNRPTFAFAYAGLGRIEKSKKQLFRRAKIFWTNHTTYSGCFLFITNSRIYFESATGRMQPRDVLKKNWNVLQDLEVMKALKYTVIMPTKNWRSFILTCMITVVLCSMQ